MITEPSQEADNETEPSCFHNDSRSRRSAQGGSSGLLFLAFQSICLGQVYSYVDASVGETDVVGYSAVTGYYNGSTHIYTTTLTITSPTGRSTTASNSGESVTAYLSINEEAGWFSVNTQFYGTCPGGGYTHVVGGGGNGVQAAKTNALPA